MTRVERTAVVGPYADREAFTKALDEELELVQGRGLTPGVQYRPVVVDGLVNHVALVTGERTTAKGRISANRLAWAMS